MMDNAHVSAKELSKIVNISQRKVEENISKLKKKGILQRIGSPRSGYWKVINLDEK